MILFESRASIILFNVLNSLSIKGKVLLPLNICPIVPSILLKLKVDFDFIDIDNKTLCMDEYETLEKLKIDSSISIIIFVHTFGIEINKDDFFKKIKKINEEIFIIDDRCLMIPDFDIDIEENLSDLIIYSTGYSKYVDISWGGFAFLKNKYTYEKTSLEFNEKDLNDFSSQIQKAINTESFFHYKDTSWLGSNISLYKKFDEYKSIIENKTRLMKRQKERLNKIYSENLPKDIFLGKEFNNWRFSILVKNKEELLDNIFKENLFASSHYKEVEFMFKKEYKKESNARKIHKNIVNLFNDFRYDEEKAYKTVEIINKCIKG
jgi:hypothetical protein